MKIELLEREGDIRIERDIRGSSEAGDGPSGAETGGLDPVCFRAGCKTGQKSYEPICERKDRSPGITASFPGGNSAGG